MFCKNHDEAIKQAQANADRSGIAWVIVRDTNGNWHAESSQVTSPDAECVVRTIEPGVFEGECRIAKDKRSWRVDAPDGNFSYQPSKEFAISWARRWTVAHHMAQRTAEAAAPDNLPLITSHL